MVDGTSGEIIERRSEHEAGEAEAFYAALPSPARVGMQATGHTHCFERVLVAQGHELWVGKPALIRATEVRKQKMDWRDALHILPFRLEDRFLRMRVPFPTERDVWQLLRQWHKRVYFRTSVKNQLQPLPMGQGIHRIFQLNNLEAP
jgi:transposase